MYLYVKPHIIVMKRESREHSRKLLKILKLQCKPTLTVSKTYKNGQIPSMVSEFREQLLESRYV